MSRCNGKPLGQGLLPCQRLSLSIHRLHNTSASLSASAIWPLPPLFLACSLLFAGVTQESTRDWSIQSAKEFPLTYVHHLRLGLGTLMSLLIRYSPMASYFWLSLIFLTPQILCHAPCWCDLLWHLWKPSHDHHWLYPIPITPLARYHVRDLSYDLQTTSLHFPFLVFSLYPMYSFVVRPIADPRTAWSGPYHTFRHTRTLCSFYLSFVFKTFVSTAKKKFSPRTQT